MTGRRWVVVVVSSGGAPTLAAQAAATKAQRLAEVGDDPQIRQVLALFPGAQVVDVRQASDTN